MFCVFFRTIGLVLLALPLWSCAMVNRGPSPIQKDLEVKTAEAGPYYYYMRSYLMKNRAEMGEAVEMLGKAVAKDKDSLFLKTELGNLYVQQNDYKQALAIFEHIVRDDPKNVTAIIMLAEVLSALGDHGEAIKAYEKALALEPNSERIHLLLGSEYVKGNEPERALELYKRLTEVNPESFAGFFHLGTVAASLKDYPLAESAFVKCLALKPDYEQTRFELVNLYEAMGKPDRVVDMYKDILDSNPDSIKAAVGLGHYYLRMERTADAERVFEELKIRSRSNPLVVKQIALIYLDQKKYAEAARTFQMLSEADSDQPEIDYFLGMALEGLEKTDEAISAYERVTDVSSYYGSAIVHLSFLYQEKGDREKAIALMHQAIEKEPDEPGLYLFLGAIYEEMESYSNAIDALRKGLELEPDHVRLSFRLGVVYDKAGQKEACIAQMKTVIEIEPTHAEALNYLGYTYAELDTNLDEAEDLVKRAMTLKPNDGYITDSMGWIYFKKGLFQEAVKYLEEAVRLVPDDPTILEHLGDAYIKLGKPEKGLELYRKALDNKEKDTESIEKKITTVEKQLRDPR